MAVDEAAPDRAFTALGDPVRQAIVARRRPCHLAPSATEAPASWIDTYRLATERAYRRLDAVLDTLEES